MIKFFVELFIFYILYKLIFELIIPTYSAAKQMSRKMDEFQRKMQQHQSAPPTSTPPKSGSGNSPSDKEYIDFEEIK